MSYKLQKGARKISTFSSYEEYLDSYVTKEDLKYLDDIEIARQIVENNKKDIFSRKEFDEYKKKLKRKNEEFSSYGNVGRGTRRGKKRKQKICGIGKDLAGSPLLYELAKKEKMVRDGRLSTIIFIRDFDKSGHEVSGYIDISDRFENEDFEKYFSKKRKLLPKPTDLSYYDWDSKILRYNESNTFTVKTDEKGLLFKHKKDRKTINVNPKSSTVGVNSTRKVLLDPNYVQVVVYSHYNKF